MFVCCPVTYALDDAEWFDDVSDAQEDALNWSVELDGEDVLVYEAIEKDSGYEFKPLTLINA